MNMSAPRINGDPNNITSLKSYTRRLIACEMELSFTSNQVELDVESKIFEEDVNLKNFLQGDLCRLAYIKHQLLPFISSNSQTQCIDILMNPGDKINGNS